MATSIGALKLVTSALLSTKPWLRDPDVVPIPWRLEIEQKTLARATSEGRSNAKLPLKLGILFNDGYMTPHPPVTRGLQIVRDAIIKAGHKVVLKSTISCKTLYPTEFLLSLQQYSSSFYSLMVDMIFTSN